MDRSPLGSSSSYKSNLLFTPFNSVSPVNNIPNTNSRNCSPTKWLDSSSAAYNYFDGQRSRDRDHTLKRSDNEKLHISEISQMQEDQGDSSKSKLPEVSDSDSSNMNRNPHSLIQYILPGLQTLRWVFILPCKFKYNFGTRTYYRVDDGPLWKVIVFILQILSVIFLWNNVNRLTSVDEIQKSQIGMIYRITYICFAVLTITLYWTFWTHRECINVLLGRIERLGSELVKDASCILPQHNHIKYAVWSLLAFFGFYCIAYTIIFEITHGNLQDLSSPKQFLAAVVHEAELNLHYGTGWISLKTRMPASDLQGYNLATALLICITYFIIVLYQTITWMAAFTMILLWGFLFLKLFQTYFNIMNKTHRNARFKLRYIRLFQMITILIEDYNRIFGMNILFAIASCMLYLSINSWNLVTSFGSNIGVNLLVAGACVMISTLLLVCSEVNNTAGQMSMMIKMFYQHTKLWRETLVYMDEDFVEEMVEMNNSDTDNRSGDAICNFIKCAEVTQGLGMIQHDLQANTIGFKGYGFFTISYSFMGTVISILVTYSVLFQQFRGTTTI